MGVPGDTLTMLSRLGNRRRVRSGIQEEDLPSDVSGTSPGIPEEIPTPLQAGMQEPGLFDIRANEIIEPISEQIAPEGPQQVDFYQLGNAIGKLSGKKEDEFQEGQEFPTPPQEDASAGVGKSIFQSIYDYFSPEKRKEVESESLALREKTQESIAARERGESPDDLRKKEVERQYQIDQAIKEPWQNAVFGAADQVANSPDLQFQLDQFNIPSSPEELEMIKKYEAVMSGKENEYQSVIGGYDAEIESIKNRIQNNQSTEQDKYYIGLALMMPLLIGGIFGGEAGLAALGGAAKGVSGAFEGREKRAAEGQEQLSDLMKSRSQAQLKLGELELERLKIPSEIRKGIPENPLSHLKGMRVVNAPSETGEPVPVAAEIKPGLLAPTTFIPDKESLKEMRKEAQDINEDRLYLDRLNRSSADILEILDKMEEKGLPRQFFENFTLKAIPEFYSKLAPEIEYKGRKVNAGPLLGQKLESLVDDYRKLKQIRGFGEQVVSHAEKIFGDPIGKFLSPRDVRDQLLEFRQLARDSLLQKAGKAGFIPEYLANDFRDSDRQIYGSLNKRAQKEQAEKEKQDLMREEENK